MELIFCIDNANGIDQAEIPLKPKHTTIIYGPNRSGKTRILRLLADFYEGRANDNTFLLAIFDDEDMQRVYVTRRLVDMVCSFPVSSDDSEEATLRDDAEVAGEFMPGMHSKVMECGGRKFVTYYEDKDSLEDVIEAVKQDGYEADLFTIVSDIDEGFICDQFHPRFFRFLLVDRLNYVIAGGKEGYEKEGLSPGVENIPIVSLIINSSVYRIYSVKSKIDDASLREIAREAQGMDPAFLAVPCISEEVFDEAFGSIKQLKQECPALYKGAFQRPRKDWDKKMFAYRGRRYYEIDSLGFELNRFALPRVFFHSMEEGYAGTLRLLEEAGNVFAGQLLQIANYRPHFFGKSFSFERESDPTINNAEFTRSAKAVFSEEISALANEFFGQWYEVILLKIHEDLGSCSIIPIEKGSGGSGEAYDIAYASSVETMWAMLAIEEALDKAYMGIYRSFAALYMECFGSYFDDTEPSHIDNPVFQLTCDSESIRGFCQSLMRSIEYDYCLYAKLPDYLKPWSAIYCIDEPELHSHASAQRMLASKMQSICRKRASLLLATHSPYFFDLGNIITVRTNSDNGFMKITTMSGEALESHRARMSMGWTTGEYFLSSPHFLFVEGQNDLAVLDELYGDFMARWSIRPIGLGTTWRLGSIANPFTGEMFKNVESLECSLLLDRGEEGLYRLFKELGPSLDYLFREYVDAFENARWKNRNNEDEVVEKECVEAAKAIEKAMGRKNRYWREDDEHERNGDYAYIKRVEGYIQNALERDPYITILRFNRRGLRIRPFFLNKPDILYYLDYSIIDEEIGASKGTLEEALKRSRIRNGSKRIKEAMREVTGSYPNEGFIRRVATRMRNVYKPVDGYYLTEQVNPALDEISNILSAIAAAKGYNP